MTEPTQGIPEDRTAPVPRPEPVPRQRSRAHGPGPGRVMLAAALAGLLGGLGGGVLTSQLLLGEREDGSGSAADAADRVSGQEQAAQVPAGQPDGAASTEPVVPAPAPADGTIPGLSRAVLPSVALISVGDALGGQGSGFVIREDGYLLTNHHVIASASDTVPITVELPGEDPVEAELVGSDAAYDIAVLRVDRDGLPALPFAGTEIEVGQTVVAVGAPLGLDSTVTSGIVSALDRPVVAGEDPTSLAYINAIQTDAAINPGNSGGPLLDLGGQVVGVNSAIAQLPTSSFGGPAGNIGVGFAIPAAQAERTATQLIETGRSEHPVMGVRIDLAYTGDGARVLPEMREGMEPVTPGGPAEAAGVLPGDVIVSVDGIRVRDSRHLLVMLRSYEVGDTVQIVLRDPEGDERTVGIILVGAGR